MILLSIIHVTSTTYPFYQLICGDYIDICFMWYAYL